MPRNYYCFILVDVANFCLAARASMLNVTVRYVVAPASMFNVTVRYVVAPASDVPDDE